MNMRDIINLVTAVIESSGYDPMKRGPRVDSSSRQWIDDETPHRETVEIGGVARPLYNSENMLIAPTFDTQNAFWQWFGKSKIVDQYGRPLVAHRGDKVGKSVFSGREDTSRLKETFFLPMSGI